MAQNDQDSSTTAAPQEEGLQLQIPGLDQFSDLKFYQGEVNPVDLVVKFPDGSEAVFPNYIPLAQAGAPPALTLEDGTVVPGAEIVSLIDNLNYDLIATAAGDTGGQGTNGGGGAAFTADPSGQLGDHIGHGPYAGGIEIANQVGFTQVPGLQNPGSSDPDPDPGSVPFDVVDDHVIHNIQAGAGDYDNYIDIPDVALRHNDNYPRGDWDLTSVSLENPWPHNPSQANFEDQMVANTIPDNSVLESTDFSGSNTTARFDSSGAGFSVAGGTEPIYFSNVGVMADENGSSDVKRDDWDLASFTLQTEAPTPGGWSDWDATSIYLYEGETITITHGDNTDQTAESQYYIALDIDGISNGGSNPLVASVSGLFGTMNWNYSSLGSGQNPNAITYTASDSGYVYIGTGFAGTNESFQSLQGKYETMIEIDGVPYGEFDYTATDNVESGDAHVTVDAIEETTDPTGLGLYALDGTSGDDIIISGDNGDNLSGNGGQDVLIGRGGDDHLTGGAGRDLFLFEHAETTATTITDGQDTIYDFSAAEGDIINLDALFDELGVLSADREGNLLADNITTPGQTVLTVEDAGGVAVAGFSITLKGCDFDSGDIAQLITDGNLVVDQS